MNRLNGLLGMLAVVTVLGMCEACSGLGDQKSGHAANHVIVIENMHFDPQELSIKKGDTITFVNQDIVPHNATEIKRLWGSPTLRSGDKWQFIPTHTADYYCSLHLVMKGKINVQE